MSARRLASRLASPRSWLIGSGVTAIGLIIGQTAMTSTATAKPAAAQAFCSVYSNAKVCENGPAPCATCHTAPPARNLYGAAISEKLAPGQARPLSDSAFLAGLPDVLKSLETADSDGDGVSNLAEILGGSQMADATSVPLKQGCSASEAASAAKAGWNVCGYDPAYVFKKVNLDFCGRSASRSEVAAFDKLKGDPKAWRAGLSASLDQCLTSRYWLGREGVVWSIANAKIKPAYTVKSGENAGPVPLGDYDDDYNLFSWANSGDRDVRDLLLAQYYVKRTSDDPVAMAVIPEDELAKRSRQTSQNVPKDKRVGMITTRWNAAINTMFTPVPRTTAAQAYRAYLGYDIAKMQGLSTVEHEPVDYDNKGVKVSECAACHATLDPLSYPFTRYNGIGQYNYSADRLKSFVKTESARITDVPERGVIMGHEVNDLREWGEFAANSDPFAQKVVFDYWKLLIGREPEARPQDKAEYNRLWKDLKTKDGYDYRVEKMLHGLILTKAYGQP